MSKLSRPSTISPLLKTAGLNSIRLELKKPVVAQVELVVSSWHISLFSWFLVFKSSRNFMYHFICS